MTNSVSIVSCSSTYKLAVNEEETAKGSGESISSPKWRVVLEAFKKKSLPFKSPFTKPCSQRKFSIDCDDTASSLNDAPGRDDRGIKLSDVQFNVPFDGEDVWQGSANGKDSSSGTKSLSPSDRSRKKTKLLSMLSGLISPSNKVKEISIPSTSPTYGDFAGRYLNRSLGGEKSRVYLDDSVPPIPTGKIIEGMDCFSERGLPPKKA